jgi:hypothetical protein
VERPIVSRHQPTDPLYEGHRKHADGRREGVRGRGDPAPCVHTRRRAGRLGPDGHRVGDGSPSPISCRSHGRRQR